MSHLFSEYTLRDVTYANRVGVSPMCQYSCEDGFANDWHFAHLAARAVGGAGLVFTEAAAVTPEGRISPQDLGVWSEKHFEPLERIARFIRAQGAVAGIQLAHAGRKGSTYRPWSGQGSAPESEGGWRTVAPSPVPVRQVRGAGGTDRPAYPGAEGGVRDRGAARLGRAASGRSSFTPRTAISSISSCPRSAIAAPTYGGSFDNRTRFLRDCARVRSALPDSCPLIVRISADDWTEGGWDLEQSIELARRLKDLGVDAIDCSSGGNVENARIPVGPGYQVPFSQSIRREAGIATAAVGVITDPAQADEIVRNGEADLVLIARELLRDP